MDQTLAQAPTLPAVTFKDGLGERFHVVNLQNEALEVLALSSEIAAVPVLEGGLRERIARLAAFQHDAFGHVRGVTRLGKKTSGPVVMSDEVPGTRLSDILAFTSERRIPIEFNAALCLIRQLVTAVTALHEHANDVSHGALAPERIVVMRDGRLKVVEHVLGIALEELRFSQDRYWRELRIAMPWSIGLPRFDRRADVLQVGTVALALILGRPLTDDDYPGNIDELTNTAAASSPAGELEPLPGPIRSWLSRALQLDPRRAFTAMAEVSAELEACLGDAGRAAEDHALELFLTRYTAGHKAAPQQPTAVTPAPRAPVAAATEPRLPVPATVPVPPPSAAPAPAYASLTEIPAPEKPMLTRPLVTPGRTPRQEDRDFDTSLADESVPFPPQADESDLAPWRAGMLTRRRLVLIGAVVLALASAGVLATRSWFAGSADVTGTLIVNTTPAGVAVVVDGQHGGSTPLTMRLAPGDHILELVSENGVRRIPVKMTAGGEVSQFIEIPKAPMGLGQLQVRTDPPGARVTVDGYVFGASPLLVQGLASGPHTVVLENATGSVTHRVTIDPGTRASLVVPMTAPQNAPLSGWISLNAPVDLQIFEGGKLLGTSATDRIMVAVGEHDLTIANEALGFRATRTVQVAPGRVSAVRVDVPKGSLSVNALPWAEVVVNGQSMGETPIGDLALPIGQHEVVFRHPELGERRATVTISLQAPARLSVDLRKK